MVMTKRTSLTWYTILGLIILMQVYPIDRPSVSSDNPNDLLLNTEIPIEVGEMLRTACYDCHSNETAYPWYTNIAPVKFLIYRDINEGREHLNFSNWTSMSKMDIAGALSEISDEVSDGDMPMKIYPITHPDAKLSDEDRALIVKWVDDYTELLFE